MRYEKQQGTEWYIGTGWPVNKDSVVTAGHNLYDKKMGHATDILVYIKYHGHGNQKTAEREFRSGRFAALHWGYSKVGLAMYDFTLIRTTSSFLGVVSIR